MGPGGTAGHRTFEAPQSIISVTRHGRMEGRKVVRHKGNSLRAQWTFFLSQHRRRCFSPALAISRFPLQPTEQPIKNPGARQQGISPKRAGPSKTGVSKDQSAQSIKVWIITEHYCTADDPGQKKKGSRCRTSTPRPFGAAPQRRARSWTVLTCVGNEALAVTRGRSSQSITGRQRLRGLELRVTKESRLAEMSRTTKQAFRVICA